MQKEIRYTGMGVVPSDNESQDGQLSLSLNMLNEGAGLKPIEGAETVCRLPGGYILLATHNVADYTNYIFVNRERTEAKYWKTRKGAGLNPTPELSDIEGWETASATIQDVRVLGNVLILISDTVRYIWWNEGVYRYLGSKIPEVDLHFTMMLEDMDREEAGVYDSHKDINFEHEATVKADLHIANTSDDRSYRMGVTDKDALTNIMQAAYATYNSYVAEAHKQGFFVHPFMVRYAVRMYDGTVTHQSAPILMASHTPVNGTFQEQRLRIFWDKAKEKIDGDSAWKFVFRRKVTKLSQLACCIPKSLEDILEKWGDLISSIDIYASAPIYPVKLEPEQSEFYSALEHSAYLAYKNAVPSIELHQEKYDEVFWYYDNHGGECGHSVIYLPPRSADEISNDLVRNSAFYLIHSYSVAELKKMTAAITGSDDCIWHRPPLHRTKKLLTLTSQPTLRDNYISHNEMGASSAMEYNNRLSLAGVQMGLFNGFGVALTNEDIIDVSRLTETACDNTETGKRKYASQTDVIVTYKHNGSAYSVHRRFARPMIPLSRCDRLTDNNAPMHSSGGASHVPASGDRASNESGWPTMDTHFRGLEYGEEGYTDHSGLDDSSDDGSQASEDGISVGSNRWAWWFYYPSAKATRMRIRQKIIIIPDRGSNQTTVKYFSVDLSPHETLNGAYALFVGASPKEISEEEFKGEEYADVDFDTASLPIKPTPKLYFDNQVYTSVVNNPFCFEADGIMTVGSGQVRCISTAAKPLSQGQFGQYPLYVFCSDGVWAITISDKGAMAAKQPITRDVCIDAQSITQLEQSVLFATERGILELQGAQATCITDIINNSTERDYSNLPRIDLLHDMIPHSDEVSCLRLMPLAQFVTGCRMVYDYGRQRIYLYNPDVDYCYVYSLKSGMWGLSNNRLQYHLRSYPEALAVNRDNELVRYAVVAPAAQPQGYSAPKIDGLIITRPMTLGLPGVMKTVDTMVQRGTMERGDVQTILYGSRDLEHWHIVWSSRDIYMRGFRGTPYKYYRLALHASMGADKLLTGATVGYRPRLTDQIR